MKRKDIRLRELENQKGLRAKPIQLVASAVVVPSRMLGGKPEKAADEFEARKVSEERGMDAVMARFIDPIDPDVASLIRGRYKDSREPVIAVAEEGQASQAPGGIAEPVPVHARPRLIWQYDCVWANGKKRRQLILARDGGILGRVLSANGSPPIDGANSSHAEAQKVP